MATGCPAEEDAIASFEPAGPRALQREAVLEHANMCRLRQRSPERASWRRNTRTKRISTSSTSSAHLATSSSSIAWSACAECGMQYISPRLRGDLIFRSYAEGEDPVYVSQMQARERTFAASRLATSSAESGGQRAAPRRRDGGRAGSSRRRPRAAGRRRAASQTAGSRRGVPVSYGVRIRSGSVFDQPYEPASFDVITLWDVIEHTTNPRAMLDHCRTLLKPGGILVVNYPDIGSWIARALGRRWLFLTSVHLHYFTRSTMTRLLESCRVPSRSRAAARPAAGARLHPVAWRGAQPWADAWHAAWRRCIGPARMQVPYWLGQTFVIARRTSALMLAVLAGSRELAEVLMLL